MERCQRPLRRALSDPISPGSSRRPGRALLSHCPLRQGGIVIWGRRWSRSPGLVRLCVENRTFARNEFFIRLKCVLATSRIELGNEDCALLLNFLHVRRRTCASNRSLFNVVTCSQCRERRPVRPSHRHQSVTKPEYERDGLLGYREEVKMKSARGVVASVWRRSPRG